MEENSLKREIERDDKRKVDIYKRALLEYVSDNKNNKNALTVSLAILCIERVGNL